MDVFHIPGLYVYRTPQIVPCVFEWLREVKKIDCLGPQQITFELSEREPKLL